MNKYRSCHSIEGELFFNHLNKIGYCCMLTPKGGQPVLYENYQGELIDWNEFFKNREEHIELMKSGGALKACEDCLWLREKEWDTRGNFFRYILLNIWTECNFKCIYCSNHTDTNVLNNTKKYNIIPVIKDMIEKKVITPDTKFDIAGGEAPLDKNFNGLIDVLIDAGIKNININTNASVFSKSLQNGIQKGVISIISSIDSGDKKKFEFIKKADVWDKVWHNLSQYAAALTGGSNEIRTKYIIIPGVNDTEKEIKNFIKKSKQTGVSGVILNIDLHWLRKNFDDKKTMKHVIDLTEYFIAASNSMNTDWQVWAHIEDLIRRYNIISPDEPVDLSFIFDKTKKETKLQKILNALSSVFKKR